MYMFNLAFNICDTEGFLRIVYFIKLAMNIIRYVIPIILIIMIIMDLVKNTINPNNKDGMKKVTNRLIAAVIVFLVPTIIEVFIGLTSYFFENPDDYTNKTDYKFYALSNDEWISEKQKFISNKNKVYVYIEEKNDDKIVDSVKSFGLAEDIFGNDVIEVK